MTPLLSALAGDDSIAALLSDTAQLQAMLAVEQALAEASAETGWISHDTAQAIAAAIAGFAPDWDRLKQGMARDGVVVPDLVAQLRGHLPAEHRDGLHKGATSQDIIDTALMLQLGQVLALLEMRIGDIRARLAELTARHGQQTLMAHTRMQAALPTHWGAKLASWAAPLGRHGTALEALRRSGLVLQLGGPVGDRSSFGGHGDAIAAAMARRLKLADGAPWQADRDGVAGLGGRLAQITGTLGKIGADIALLAQSEVQAITLLTGGGSSAMAHKSNPVIAETLVALARFNAGLSGVLQQAMVHEYERSGAAWTLEWLTLPPMLEATGASLRLATTLLDQIRIN